VHDRLVKMELAFNFCWSVVFSVSPAYKDNDYYANLRKACAMTRMWTKRKA